MTKYEYIWLDGYQPEANLRSKVKVTDGEPPAWSFDEIGRASCRERV